MPRALLSGRVARANVAAVQILRAPRVGGVALGGVALGIVAAIQACTLSRQFDAEAELQQSSHANVNGTTAVAPSADNPTQPDPVNAKTAATNSSVSEDLRALQPPYPIREHAWLRTGLGAIRGTTVGPIENQLHPDRGYGSAVCAHTMHEIRRMGGNWVSITPFGRVYNLEPSGVSLRFEAPFAENQAAVKGAIQQAHAEGLRVLLVPHLWVETGDWRGHIAPKTDDAWQRWMKAYGDFAVTWATIAESAQVEMLAVGVELRSWVTTARAPDFFPVIERVRKAYRGPLTYAANWDDVHDTVIWDQLDVIGINAFFPLADKEGASDRTLAEGASRIAVQLRRVAERWGKPIVFTEFGYTTRKEPAVRPWEWPEHLTNVQIDERDQARAYRALLGAMIPEPWFVGVFVWRLYADPSDVSQEPEWGFSPRGKRAELELVDAFRAHWGADGYRPLGTALGRFAVERIRAF
ncbi:MAG: glycoside hydrolase family 113 [Myxococcales bacterium]